MDKPVICLAGPTASGKTALAVSLAAHFGCEIINADSRQVYADFPIITAQPGPTERQGVPHHLYGCLTAEQGINAGQWAERAALVCGQIRQRGNIPLLVGGTGLYFRALLEGLASIPPIDPRISRAIVDRLQAEGPARLYQELGRIDPTYAARVHPNDRNRIQRALEVWRGTGRTFSWWHANSRPQPLARGPLLVVDAGLASLEARFERRIKAMLARGAVEEARRAYVRYPDRNPGWSGIGCAELYACLKGETSFAQCLDSWRANTRAYAKRQITWFRAQKNAIWIDPTDPGQASAILQNWL